MTQSLYQLEQYDYKVTVGDTYYIGLEFFGRDNLLADLSKYDIYLSVIDPETGLVIPMAAPASDQYSLRCRVESNDSDDFEGIYRYNDARGGDFLPPSYLVDSLDSANKIVCRFSPTWTDIFVAGFIYQFDIQLVMADPLYDIEKHTPLRGRLVAVESRTP